MKSIYHNPLAHRVTSATKHSTRFGFGQPSGVYTYYGEDSKNYVTLHNGIKEHFTWLASHTQNAFNNQTTQLKGYIDQRFEELSGKIEASNQTIQQAFTTWFLSANPKPTEPLFIAKSLKDIQRP